MAEWLKLRIRGPIGLPDGRLIVLSSGARKLIRLPAGGALDRSFGVDGVLPFVIPNPPFVVPLSAFQQDDGRLVVAGLTTDSGFVARYDVYECGNGLVEGLETCDDHSVAPNDCCSPSCTFEPTGTACDDGDACTVGDACTIGACAGSPMMCPTCTLCASGTCAPLSSGTSCPDDGNLCTDDQCDGAGQCGHFNNAAPYDDGTACTVEDACADGACGGSIVTCPACESCDAVAGCVDRPRADCRTASSKATLLLTSSRLAWNWRKGEAVTVTELGDPVVSDDYTLCVFDRTASDPRLLLRSSAPAGGQCKGGPCWKPQGKSGFVYADREGTPDGLTKIILRAGAAGRSKVSVTGRSPASASTGPTFPLRVQLQSPEGCFEATHSKLARGRHRSPW